jgi:hypothetical protein
VCAPGIVLSGVAGAAEGLQVVGVERIVAAVGLKVVVDDQAVSAAASPTGVIVAVEDGQANLAPSSRAVQTVSLYLHRALDPRAITLRADRAADVIVQGPAGVTDFQLGHRRRRRR